MESNLKKRNIARKRRKFRVRKKLIGSAEKPRMSVFKSNCHIYVQLIDDENRKTLVSLCSLSKKMTELKLNNKSKEAARYLGKNIANMAKEKNINKVIFDRGMYKYHGIIAELAEAARQEGIKF
jgi:large subunit ribosomal protein L18